MTDTLVFHHGALGDFVLTFPVWRAWESVTLLAADSHVKLARHLFPHVRGMNIDQPDCTRLFAPDTAEVVNGQLRTLFANARQIVSFVSDGTDAWANNVRKLVTNARIAFVHPRPPEGHRIHVCDWHARQLRNQGLEPSTDTMGAAPLIRRAGEDVVVHPGSGGRAKCWPAERYLALIDRLRHAGRRVRVLMGEVERERWSPQMIAAFAEQAQVCQPASLVDLAEQLASAAVYIGNDSGPTHLAATLGVPTVAIFGPTDPAIWCPRGPAVHVLTSTDGWPDVDRVADAIRCLVRDERW